MTSLLYARWACDACGGRGVVSGEPSDTPTQEAGDPAPFNCYHCQETVTAVLPTGLDRWHLRVEGAHGDTPAICPHCQAAAEAYWDGRDTPLAVCANCNRATRLPELPADPLAWEMLLESREEKIERRRVEGGWQFRSESYYKEGGRLRPARRVIQLEGLEADPGRPLSQIFREIRAEHARLRAEALAPPPSADPPSPDPAPIPPPED